MDDQTWTWQQDGARAQTGRASVQFLKQSTPDFIELEDCPLRDIHPIDDLKMSLKRYLASYPLKCYTSLDFQVKTLLLKSADILSIYGCNIR